MRIPKYRKNGDGRAFAVYPKSGGKREYFGKYGTHEAEDRYREWLTRLLNSEGILFQEKKMREYIIAELILKYWEYMEPRISNPPFRFLKTSLKRLNRLCGKSYAKKMNKTNLYKRFFRQFVEISPIFFS